LFWNLPRVRAFREVSCLAAMLLSLAGCGTPRPAEVNSANETAPVQAAFFTVPEAQLPHLKIVPVKSGAWSTTVHTTGTVDWDADHTTQAITQVGGPITRILVDTGATVKAGDPLLYVSSPDVANAISAYKKARNREELARRALRRTQELFDHGAVAQKDLEGAQADANDAATDVQNTLQALKIFGVTKQEIEQAERQGVPINPELAVYSPIAGVVVQKLVSPGLLIQAGQTACFTLSDVSTVWVQGHIFDRDLPSVRSGDAVDQTNAAFPQTFHGTVSYIGALVDPATRTTSVRIVTRNPGGLLKKDMFVDAVIHTRTQQRILTVPVSAVLRNEQNEPLVYVEVQPGKFAQRLVTLGAQQNDQTEIRSGLKEGENVVSEGSLFLQFANSYQ
jgi:cobalt-zinc-cadmium efflux system membrane fusion protein